MNLRIASIIVLILFGGLTAQAIVADGPDGFPNAITYNLTSLQVWLDLVIAMMFWCGWVIYDGRQAGRNPWPWIIGALIFGAFVPLIYLAVYQRWPASSVAEVTADNATTRRTVAGIVTAAFAALTAAAIYVDGSDIAATVTHSWSNIQIWVDLVIMIVFWLFWLVKDANANERNPWGWVVFAAVLGAFSPLLYLLTHGRWPGSHKIT